MEMDKEEKIFFFDNNILLSISYIIILLYKKRSFNLDLFALILTGLLIDVTHRRDLHYLSRE